MSKTFAETSEPIRIWVAAFTSPNAETAVAETVSGISYPVLLPTTMTEMRHARRAMIVERPVFPRYVFIGVPEGRSWYPLKTVTGLGGILSKNGVPQPMHVKAVLISPSAFPVDEAPRI